MFDVITLGDTTLDILLTIDEAAVHQDAKKHTAELCLKYGDKIPVHGVMKTAGGNAANVAVGTSKLGLKTALVSEIGADADARMIAEQLKKARVDLTYLAENKKSASKTNFILNFRSERTILSTPANHHYHFPKLPSTNLIYLTSMHAGAEKIYQPLLTYLKKNPHTRLASNPGSFQLREGLKDFKKMLAKIDYLFVNREEAAQIIGKRLPPKKLLAGLRKLGPRIVFMTDGPAGAYAANENEQLFLPSFPRPATNKVGAGDAFASGALAALLQKKSLTDAMKWGTANATGVISKLGAQQGLLSRLQLGLMLRQYKRVQTTSTLPPQS